MADNYRAVAEPMAAGACKTAIGALATAEDGFAAALTQGKPLAQRQKLGQQVLKRKAAIDSAC